MDYSYGFRTFINLLLNYYRFSSLYTIIITIKCCSRHLESDLWNLLCQLFLLRKTSSFFAIFLKSSLSKCMLAQVFLYSSLVIQGLALGFLKLCLARTLIMKVEGIEGFHPPSFPFLHSIVSLPHLLLCSFIAVISVLREFLI